MSGHSKWANIKRQKQANDLIRGTLFSKKQTVYEAFGPHGAALAILVTTDNVNRALSEIRTILERHQGKLGNQGSVLYLFKKCAVVVFRKSEVDESKVLSFSEEIQAFDIDEDETHFSVYIPYENLGRIKDHIHDLKYEHAEIDFKPTVPLLIEKEDLAKKIVSLVNALEEQVDVQKVFTNADIPAHLLT